MVALITLLTRRPCGGATLGEDMTCFLPCTPVVRDASISSIRASGIFCAAVGCVLTLNPVILDEKDYIFAPAPHGD